MAKSDELKLARILDFNLVPRKYLDQIKGRNWDVDALLKWGNLVAASPFELVYVIVTKEHEIKGFTWGTACPVLNGIFINAVSLDKEYQDGIIVKKITGFFNSIKDELGLKTMYSLTKRPRAVSKAGWTRTGVELMEVDHERFI